MRSTNELSHIKELENRETDKILEIKKQEKKVYQELSTSDDSFMDEYEKLNLLRLDLMTIRSRKENCGKHYSGVPQYRIPLNK